MPDTTATSALGDLRVLDLSRLLPGPFCTLMLADLGADVIKVEDPGEGDYLRHWPPLDGDQGAMYQALNRNKRSLVLDLKQAEGRDAFLRLAEASDVVVESFRPGVMDRLGIGYATLRERNRGIVLASISGFGQDGPYRERAGHDLNYASLAAIVDPAAPHLPRVQLGDIGGGALPATVAILAALHERGRSGEGQHCDIAMVDGLLAWQTGNAARLLAGGDASEGDILSGRHPCYSLYRCAGGHLSVAALEPKFWRAFVDAVGVGHLADEAFSSGETAQRVHAEIEAVLLQRTAAEWMELLAARDVCVEPVNDLAAALEHPQVRARGMLLDTAVTGGTPQLGFPLRLSRTPAAWRSPAPHQGEHSRRILHEAGYDDAAIDTLITRGVTR